METDTVLITAVHEPGTIVTVTKPSNGTCHPPPARPLGPPTESPIWYYVLSHGILTECSWVYIICDGEGCTRVKVHGEWVEQADYPRGPHMPVVTSRCEKHPFIHSGPETR